MSDDRLRQILQQADRLAGPPRPASVDVDAIRQRASATRAALRKGFAAAAAAAVVGICIWLGLASKHVGPLAKDVPASQPAADSQRIAQLEAEVKALRASSDRMLALLQEAAQQRDRDRRVAELKRELADIPDPMEQVTAQVSQAAERMVREADQLWLGQRQRRLAVSRYQRVITLFPDSEWASVARQRLVEIIGSRAKGEHI
jgi:hypothetical protein